MPTYEFRCNDCKATFDVEESVRDHDRDLEEHRMKCPKCGSENVIAQISTFEVKTVRKSA